MILNVQKCQLACFLCLHPYGNSYIFSNGCSKSGPVQIKSNADIPLRESCANIRDSSSQASVRLLPKAPCPCISCPLVSVRCHLSSCQAGDFAGVHMIIIMLTVSILTNFFFSSSKEIDVPRCLLQCFEALPYPAASLQYHILTRPCAHDQHASKTQPQAVTPLSQQP